MSFTPDDMKKLQDFLNQNDEASALFRKLLEAHKFELHKICHEIRNPLTLVSSTLQLIETQHPETKSFAHWNTLCEDLSYIESLLAELSQYNNSSAMTMERFSFRSFMERLVLSFAASTENSAIEFTSRLGNLPEITGDQTKLRQAFLNLLRNAEQSIEGPGSIFLSADAKDDGIVVEIRDTGCGMNSEVLETAFTPFVTYKSGGTGLGLPVVQNIITAHHGRLSVESTVGSGTVFFIFLPI